MACPREISSAVVVVLHVVIWCLLLRAALALWVDCGTNCGASGKPAQAASGKPRGGR